MKSLLIFSGPGVKKGLSLQRTAWLVDVAPTIAFAMNWPIPTESEGGVLYQLFSKHKSLFPRSNFLKLQDKHKEVIRARLKLEDKKESRKSIKQKTPKVFTKTVEQEEKIPETIEEMSKELKRARVEARRWRSAYERYHRIAHGN